MQAVVGPILTKEGGYAFDIWTAEEGLSCGYAYRCIGDAHYARNVEIRSRRRGRHGPTLACNTLEDFTSAVAERDATFRALVWNLETNSLAAANSPDQLHDVPIEITAEPVTAR